MTDKEDCKSSQSTTNINIRTAWTIGSKCEIYSKSSKSWYPCEISDISKDDEGEWLKTKYMVDGISKNRQVQRFNDHIRPNHQSNVCAISIQAIQIPPSHSKPPNRDRKYWIISQY